MQQARGLESCPAVLWRRSAPSGSTREAEPGPCHGPRRRQGADRLSGTGSNIPVPDGRASNPPLT